MMKKNQKKHTHKKKDDQSLTKTNPQKNSVHVKIVFGKIGEKVDNVTNSFGGC